jgi:AGCS family alanine or glycine:cation symporter
MINELITQINDVLWGYVLIAALVSCGLWFTWKTRGVQFRMVGEMFRLLTDSATSGINRNDDRHHARRHISSFQAFAVSVATRVGTGNLAGVATAIAIGGPGAVFWMWVIALIGSATAFVESTLGQLFKQRHENSFIGGPAYYIEKGLHSPFFGSLFAVLAAVAAGFLLPPIHSNSISVSLGQAFGVPAWIVGIGVALLIALVIIGVVIYLKKRGE